MINKTSVSEKYKNLIDDELRKIIYINSDEYEIENIELAKAELFSRYDKNIWESDNVILKELISNTNLETIINKIIDMFPYLQDEIDSYCDIFNTLVNKDPRIQDEIFISLDPDDIFLNNEGHWTLYGEDTTTNEKLQIEYCMWDEWLGFRVKTEQLQQIGLETYIIHCLMELTSLGFNENTIQNKFEMVNEGIDDISNENQNQRDLLKAQKQSEI